MELLFNLMILLLLVAIGYWRGRRNERVHLQWLAAEEEKLADVLVFASRYPPASNVPLDPVLVTGSVVLVSDYFRFVLAGLRKIVGGNYRAYETLLERARRDAVVRMKRAALAKGANRVFNVRFTTTRIANSQRQGASVQVEVLAYGTVLLPAASVFSATADQLN